MSSKEFPLKYQSKTTGVIIYARRRGDQSYSIYVPGQETPERYPASKMRREFEFIESELPNNAIKIRDLKTMTGKQ